MVVQVKMLTQMLILKWIEKIMLKCSDVDDDLDSSVDDEIGTGNGEEV